MTLKSTKFITSICESLSKSTGISPLALGKLPKENKFWNQWIFDPEQSKCEETGIWCQRYIQERYILCEL